jgi:hypothetical protein
VSAERVLVNFFSAHPVGHAIEGLHYALDHHAADPSREVAIALSARTPVRSRTGAHDEDGPRVPSMSRARIRDDRDAIVAAAVELCAAAVTYDDALADYFHALLRAHGGDPSAIWSIDGVHTRYV